LKRFLIITIGLLIVAGIVLVARNRYNEPKQGSLTVQMPTLVWPPETPSGTPLTTPPKTARFIINNTGGRPVRILSIESGCGCAKPKVEPATIAPGNSGRVIVDFKETSLNAGDRTIPIALFTDSPITHRVNMYLQLEDTRKPPFVFAFSGDLIYQNPRIEDTREVRIDTVELLTEKHNPTVRSNLAFLRIDLKSIQDKKHPKQENTVVRSYVYTVSFASPPPMESFQGTVSAQDPFYLDRTLTLNVFGEITPAVRVTPARAILRIGSHISSNPEAQFMVLSIKPLQDLRVMAEAGDASPLVIELAKSHPSESQAVFTVRYRPSPSETVDGIHNIFVWTSLDKNKPVVVPIMVQHREAEAR
jgi:hypothetical protein